MNRTKHVFGLGCFDPSQPLFVLYGQGYLDTLLIVFDQSFIFSFRVIHVYCNPCTNNLRTWLLQFIIARKEIITCGEKAQWLQS